MNSHQFFEVSKTTIERVGGIGDIEIWIFFIGKEERKVLSYTPIGRAKPFMGIVPSSGYRVGCSFFQEGRPCCIPDIKG